MATTTTGAVLATGLAADIAVVVVVGLVTGEVGLRNPKNPPDVVAVVVLAGVVVVTGVLFTTTGVDLATTGLATTTTGLATTTGRGLGAGLATGLTLTAVVVVLFDVVVVVDKGFADVG